MNQFPTLTLLILTPLIGGTLVLLFGKTSPRSSRRLALTSGLLSMGLSLGIFANFDRSSGALQMVEQHEWIPSLSVTYHLGIDGLGLLMVCLTSVVVLMSISAATSVGDRAPLYFCLVLWLQSGLFGTFTALNFFPWFLFWELSLVPAFFLVLLWGGPARAAAATNFFIYTMLGSVTLLLAFLAVFLSTGQFDFLELAESARAGTLNSALSGPGSGGPGLFAWLAFWGAFLGFAVKLPVVPFHTWLPLTYSQAPFATTMLLTGAMSKMGAYGFLRILLPIFPDQVRACSGLLLGLAVASILYSASVALVQRDLRKLLAYSSINHLGYCLLGMVAVFRATEGVQDPGFERTAALNGVFLHMFNHGVTAAMLFWMAGVLTERTGVSGEAHSLGGLRKPMPILTGFIGIALFSSLGLPGLNGFIGEFLIFKGTFSLAPWAAAAALPGLLLTAVFILRLVEQVFFGPTPQAWAGLRDLDAVEIARLSAPLALMVAIGVYPQILIGFVNRTAMAFVQSTPF